MLGWQRMDTFARVAVVGHNVFCTAFVAAAFLTGSAHQADEGSFHQAWAGVAGSTVVTFGALFTRGFFLRREWKAPIAPAFDERFGSASSDGSRQRAMHCMRVIVTADTLLTRLQLPFGACFYWNPGGLEANVPLEEIRSAGRGSDGQVTVRWSEAGQHRALHLQVRDADGFLRALRAGRNGNRMGR